MSIPVALDDLPDAIAGRRAGAYLLTVGEDGPRATSAGVRWDGTDLLVGAGRRTSASIAARPAVALLWPADEGSPQHALLVDGTAAVADGTARITPTSAILHVVGRGG